MQVTSTAPTGKVSYSCVPHPTYAKNYPGRAAHDHCSAVGVHACGAEDDQNTFCVLRPSAPQCGSQVRVRWATLGNGDPLVARTATSATPGGHHLVTGMVVAYHPQKHGEGDDDDGGGSAWRPVVYPVACTADGSEPHYKDPKRCLCEGLPLVPDRVHDVAATLSAQLT